MADPRLKPVKCKRTLAEYAERVTWCEACGIVQGRAVLAIHHVIKRGRSDDRTNLIRLCDRRFDGVWPCHYRAEAQGPQAVWFPLGLVLSIKKLRDPAGWNEERLVQLRLKPLPDLIPIPAALLAEFDRWKRFHPKEPEWARPT